MYMCISVCVCVYIYIYIYVYNIVFLHTDLLQKVVAKNTFLDSPAERLASLEVFTVYDIFHITYMYMYIYIYRAIYVYVYVYYIYI